MSGLTSIRADVYGLHPLSATIRNADGTANEVVELSAGELWRLDGDNRWRAITCVRGEIWVTQKRDVQDYVLAAGDIFLVTQRGKVLIEALHKCSVEVTPPLRRTPYRGKYPLPV